MDRVTGARQKTPLRIEIGKAIQRQRQDRGYSQGKVAKSANLSLKYVGEVERGSANVTIDVIERIAAVLDWNPLEVLAGIREPLDQSVRGRVVHETEQVRERLGELVAWLRAIDHDQRKGRQ